MCSFKVFFANTVLLYLMLFLLFFNREADFFWRHSYHCIWMHWRSCSTTSLSMSFLLLLLLIVSLWLCAIVHIILNLFDFFSKFHFIYQKEPRHVVTYTRFFFSMLRTILFFVFLNYPPTNWSLPTIHLEKPNKLLNKMCL